MRILLVAALLLGPAVDAGAARRSSGWLWDTDVLPERTTELEWWTWERTGVEPRVVYLAVSGVVGLTDHLELALPLELGLAADGPGTRTHYGLELRARLASPDASRAGPIVPTLRFGVQRLVQTDEARLDLGATLSFAAGALRVVVDAAGVARTGAEEMSLVGGAGASWAVTDELRLGAELYAELGLAAPDDAYDRWVTAGPTLAFTHGRFWIAASLAIGLHDDAPTLLPRLSWAIAF